MIESEILKRCWIAASSLGATLFRNNTGTAWQGIPVKMQNGDLLLKKPRIIKFGLCVGGGDLIGWRSVTITQEMVGKKLAQFVAIETKTTKGRATDEQKNFLNQLAKSGGAAILTTSAEDTKQQLSKGPTCE